MAYFEYRTRKGDVLDLLCLRIYRADGMIDAVLMANPTLLNLDEILPSGIMIRFPKVTNASAPTKNNVVKLWG